MNKLVIVGNGFDLAHGLRTRYIDFLLWYLNDAIKNLFTKYVYNDSLIEASMHYRIAKPADLKSIKDYTSFRKQYHDIKFTFKHEFFESLLDKAEIANWVDIESEYYSWLISLFKELEKDGIENHPNIDQRLNDLNDCFDVIKEKLSEYLTIVNKSNMELDSEIANHFLNEFSNEKSLKKSSTMFLNFNYTSTLKLYSEILDSVEYTINYIHGKLNDYNNPIIFGYGDEIDSYYEKIERLNSNEFLKNIKSFGYFKTSNYQDLSRFISSGTFRVIIIGHSCGLSDRILLNSIFENKNCNSIKIYYHKRNEKENDFFEKTQELSRHFPSSFKGRMRNLILPFSKSMPLKNN